MSNKRLTSITVLSDALFGRHGLAICVGAKLMKSRDNRSFIRLSVVNENNNDIKLVRIYLRSHRDPYNEHIMYEYRQLKEKLRSHGSVLVSFRNIEIVAHATFNVGLLLLTDDFSIECSELYDY